jgi:hypothetical protein
MDTWGPLCLNFIMFQPWGKLWFIVQPIFPTFRLSSPNFPTMFWTQLKLPHPSIACILLCVCTHPIDPMGVHLLHYTHGNEHIGTYDAIHDIFVVIAWDVGFHVGQTQLHALLSTTFNSSHWQVDIVLTKNKICTLTNVVITNPTHADLLSQFCPIQGFATFDATQAKERSHHNQHPTNQFLLLTIEVFECLHK